MASIGVRPMTPADLDRACQIIGLAFAGNPSTLANVRGDRDRACQTMQRAVRIAKFGSRWSHAFVAEEGSQLVGVLNAAPWPHCRMGAAEKLKTAPAMIRIMGSALPRAATMLSARAKHDPKAHHWPRATRGGRGDAGFDMSAGLGCGTGIQVRRRPSARSW